MADTWDPARYRDDYVPALMKVIESKAEGATPRRPATKKPVETNVVDLVARLKESLKATAGARAAATSDAAVSAPAKSAKTTAAGRGGSAKRGRKAAKKGNAKKRHAA
jgi:DNA end-binding protein Ku